MTGAGTRRTREAVTADIMRLLDGSDADLQRVLDLIVSRAAELLDAPWAVIYLAGGDMITRSAEFLGSGRLQLYNPRGRDRCRRSALSSAGPMPEAPGPVGPYRDDSSVVLTSAAAAAPLVP